MTSGLHTWSLPNPITNRRIGPDTKPPRTTKSPSIHLWGACTQYLPASFVLHSPRTINNIRIDASALRCGRHRIASDQVDLHIVKCWYMAGLGVWADPRKSTNAEFDVLAMGSKSDAGRENPGIDGGGYIMSRDQLHLAPELLLKDDELIDFDRKRQDNIYRFTGLPTDSPKLLPFQLRANESKQIWVTVYLPPDTVPGRYQGQIRIRAPKRASIAIPITLDVTPIHLDQPALQYMQYYDSFITAPWSNISHSKYRTPQQMLAELCDLRAHGVENTTVCEPITGDQPNGKTFDFSNIDRVMDLREKAGFPVRKQTLFWTPKTTSSGRPDMLTDFYKHDPWIIDKPFLQRMERTIKAVLRWSKRRGIPEVCVYGIDEVQDQKLKAEIRAFKVLQKLGAKIMLAVSPNFHDYLGDYVDVANVQGDPHNPKQIPPRVIRRIHAKGGRIFNYARPQTGECRPYTYRRNYGIDMYTSGMDGPWPYGYQCTSGRYQAYDRIHTTHGSWLNHPFSYPTTDGVMITWGSQGWRAAVDDVRYMTTLQNMIDAGEGTGANRSKAREFLKNLDSDGNLPAQRRNAAQLIEKLHP